MPETRGLEKGICKFLKLLDQPALKMAKGLSGLLSGETLAIISLRSFMTSPPPPFFLFQGLTPFFHVGRFWIFVKLIKSGGRAEVCPAPRYNRHKTMLGCL